MGSRGTVAMSSRPSQSSRVARARRAFLRDTSGPISPKGPQPARGARPSAGTGKFTDRAAHRLKIAGMLLQSTNQPGGKVHIKPMDGENYLEAVLRIVQTLPPDEQSRLREHVDWVEDYDNAESAVEAAARETQNRAG